MCNIFKAMGPLLAKPQLTPATQSEDRHVWIAYPFDYEDGSGLNEEHNIMDAGPRFSFHLQRIGGKGWGCSNLEFTNTPKVLHQTIHTYGAFTLDVKSVLNENLGGTQC